MMPYYAAHLSPREARTPLAYAGPWSTGPPPASLLQYFPAAPAPPPAAVPG